MSDRAKKTLTVGLLSPVGGLDPRDVQDYASALVMRQIFEGPFDIPQTGNPARPRLFRAPLEIRERAGRTRYVGRLRSDVLFSDGTPLTADMAAACLANVGAIGAIAEVSIHGDQIVFDTGRPDHRLEAMLGMRWCSLVQERDGALLGTGAYALDGREDDGTVRLVRNRFHQPAPPIDELRFAAYPPSGTGRSEALLAAVTRGEVDFSPSLGREEMVELEGVRKLFRPGNSVSLLFFNTERPWLSDPALRRAIANGIDRHALAALSYTNPAAFVAHNPLPPSMSRLRDAVRVDRATAAAAVGAAAALSRPLRMLVIWAPRPYLPHPMRVAAALRAQLTALGVSIEIEQEQTSAQYFERTRCGDYDVVLCGWMADTPDPADYLDALLSSGAIPTPTRSAVVAANLARWDDPEMDERLDAFRNEPTAERLRPLLERVRDAAPFVPLTYGPSAVVHAWRVKGFSPDAEGELDFSSLDVED